MRIKGEKHTVLAGEFYRRFKDNDNITNADLDTFMAEGGYLNGLNPADPAHGAAVSATRNELLKKVNLGAACPLFKTKENLEPFVVQVKAYNSRVNDTRREIRPLLAGTLMTMSSLPKQNDVYMTDKVKETQQHLQVVRDQALLTTESERFMLMHLEREQENYKKFMSLAASFAEQANSEAAAWANRILKDQAARKAALGTADLAAKLTAKLEDLASQPDNADDIVDDDFSFGPDTDG